MISIIIFMVAVVVIWSLNIALFWGEMTIPQVSWVFLAAVIGMVLINGLVATICCKLLPDKWFTQNNKMFKASKKETRFYEKLGIKKWKDKTIELGILNNFRKNKINSVEDSKYIEQFIVENNKGFLEHTLSIFISIAAIFIMPKKYWLPMALPIAITSVIINGMAVMILRYNMPRLQTLLRFSQRNENKEKESIN